MPGYDDVLFAPPAPAAKVSLRDQRNGKTVHNVVMLIDTGADVTLLPAGPIKELGADTSGGEYQVMAFDGGVSIARAVTLEMFFLQRTFNGQFLIIDQEYGILGRNILNHVCLLLDGPALD